MSCEDESFMAGEPTLAIAEMPPSDGAHEVLQQGNLAARRDPYSGFYKALSALREEFHRIGRFDDANAKLDDLSTLLALKVLDARHPLASGRSRFSAEYLAEVARCNHSNAQSMAAAMHDVFSELVEHFPAEADALAPSRGLHIAPDDDEFARALIPLLESLPVADAANGSRWLFDGLNEAFGHFVQQSFRNRKEDAQYMTPPEIVSGLVEIAFHDVLSDPDSAFHHDRFFVADPTCGVGSFLAAAYRKSVHVETPHGRLSDRLDLFGQDKVERMVRLASVNLKIFAQANAIVRLGNSILPPVTLDDVAGKIDLILTNPPFGATFDLSEVLKASRPEHFPVLFDLARAGKLPATLDSEYLLLDRELALLKPGGRLMMVVPDHVVSTGGFSESFRLGLLRHAELLAVFDLSTETFAQAGTRTKTSVVYLRRMTAKEQRKRARHVFMATSEDLGFRVISRAGATVKKITGHSDFEDIVQAYKVFTKRRQDRGTIVCLNKLPSAAAVPTDKLLNNRWTAGFYKTERLAALQQIEQVEKKGFTTQPLPELVSIDPNGSDRVLADERNRCISVLHIKENGCIDLQAVAAYRPTTACVRCLPGDILLSKINPRILRIAVVPNTRWQLACSAEFAVLRGRSEGLSPWELALLLRSESVQGQIRSLTSGTSSSHNRIKDRDLRSIVLPIPAAQSNAMRKLRSLAKQYKEAVDQQYESQGSMIDCLDRLRALIEGAPHREQRADQLTHVQQPHSPGLTEVFA